MHIAQHWTILVYPFRHAVAGRTRDRRLARVRDRWHPWWRRLQDHAVECALDDTYFFLPYIRTLLFPETGLLPEGDITTQAQATRRMADLPCDRWARELPEDAVLRLTYDGELLQALHPLRLTFEWGQTRFAADLTVEWVDLVLFPQNVGFLVLKVRMEEDAPTPERLNDCLYYLRWVHPPRVDWKLPVWEHPTTDGGVVTFRQRDLVDFLLQGLTAVDGGPEPVISDLVGFLRRLGEVPEGRRYTATPDGQVYGQVFHLYTYACLAPASEEGDRSAPSLGSDLFASPADRIVYELATCTLLSDPTYIPHPSYLSRLWEQHALAFWANWRGMALHDNVVFLGTEAGPFTLRSLPHNVENDYFHLYLFVLFQKVRLSMMLGERIRREVRVARHLREARRLWDTFMEFQNHYWFAEVTRKPQGMELYRRYHQGLGVTPLYEEIKEEMRELRDHYERKFERRVSELLNVLTFVGLPAGLLVELFSNALVRQATWGQFLMDAAIMYAVIGGLWLLWRFLRRE